MSDSSTTASSSLTNQNSAFKPTYWAKLESRVTEMREKRKRFMKVVFKREGRLNEFEHGFKNLIHRKTQIVKKYTNAQIESLLRQSAQ
jgi:hypothetical protein